MQRKTPPGSAPSDELTSHPADADEFRVEDRRHSNQQDSARADDADGAPRRPSVIDEYRVRTEAAEKRLHEYIEAFKQHQRDQDEFRARIERDVDRRVELKFAGLVRELLETVDTLELGLQHAAGVAEAEPLAQGVALARDRFLAALERHGIERIVPGDGPFDPNEAEAVRVDRVDSAERDGHVTETLQPGFRLGQHVIRPARVAVGRR